MAVNIGDYAKMEFPMAMTRQGAFPLDSTSVFTSLGDAQNYAQSDPRAYVGQLISVIVDGESKTYEISNTNGDLNPLSGGGSISDENIASDVEVGEMLDEIFSDNQTEETSE
jgi:hypothetical protein